MDVDLFSQREKRWIASSCSFPAHAALALAGRLRIRAVRAFIARLTLWTGHLAFPRSPTVRSLAIYSWPRITRSGLARAIGALAVRESITRGS